MVGVQERYWRLVPKVNVLPERRRTPPKNLVLLGLLGLVVVLGAALLINQRGTREDVDQRVSQKTAELRSLRLELDTMSQAVDALHFEINQLQEQIEASKQMYLRVTAGRRDWHTALAALLEAQTSGVVFQSVVAEPQGAAVTVEGLATAPGSIASLPTRLSGIHETLDFQSIQWDAPEVPSRFIATFQVRQ